MRMGRVRILPEIILSQQYLREISAVSALKLNFRSKVSVQLSYEPASKSDAHISMQPVEGMTTVVIPCRQYGVGGLQSLTSKRKVQLDSLSHWSLTNHWILCVPIG